MSTLAWIKASRLPSQSYIALPLVLGQLIAYAHQGSLDPYVFVLVQLFGVFDQLYIVYANDYADRETDAANDTFTIFSGGSRVLVDGALRPEQLRRASILMAALAMATGVTLGVWRGTWAVPALQAAGLTLLWMYSYPPVRLSYRGGGEALQMLGVGLILPLVGFVAQTGGFQGFPWAWLAILLPLQLGCAMCTALPDEPSDRATQKRTLAVHLGNTGAKVAIVALHTFALGMWFVVGPTAPLGLLALPALALVASVLVGPRARPGTLGVQAFVFLGILVNLCVLGLLSWSSWQAVP